MPLKFQGDHSPHLETSVCCQYTFPLFTRRRGQAKTESVPVHLYNHGTVGRKCAEARGVPDWLCQLDRHISLWDTGPIHQIRFWRAFRFGLLGQALS
jgi:hypothetical protein